MSEQTMLQQHHRLAPLLDRVAQRIRNRRSRPRATYRVQFHAEFGFQQAAAIAEYLQRLGISDLYASPYLKARPGSQHGYDVCDHNRLHPELGSDDDYRALVDALQQQGLGQVLDIVPNHMGIAPDHNLWWRDVLENGPSSPYAEYFDINWTPHKEELRYKVLLPVLGAQYGNALDNGELKLAYHDGAFVLSYFDQTFPIEPRSATTLLEYRIEVLREQFGEDDERRQEYESILNALHTLPVYTKIAEEPATLRHREKEVIKRRLSRLVQECPEIAEFILQNVEAFNVNDEDPESVERLDHLLDQQPYRLSYWKVAGDEINYRRFFDINELAALCMENERVFEDTHRLILELLVRGDVLGLRIDHIDGLYDPREYLERLQHRFLMATARDEYEQLVAEQQGDWPAWDDVAEEVAAALSSLRGSSRRQILYVTVEKILGVEELLPDDWPTAGTTGYDFLNSLNGVLVDPDGLREVIRTYERFVNQRQSFDDIAYRAKLLILDMAMSSELQMLARRLNRISERNRASRDFTLNRLRHALREILACFPVYRTYIRHGEVSERDRHFVHLAVAVAKRRNPAMEVSVFDFIRDVILLEQPEGCPLGHEREVFVGRLQQVTSPVIAKGVEDTAFYVYCPLVSMNEVGAEPEHGATSVDKFHSDNLERLACRPWSLICTSTHDTKRSEDTRARIDVLSEVPGAWRSALNSWARLNRRFRREVDGMPAPSKKDEYLFYQTLLGVWPPDPVSDEEHAELIQRLQQYMAKATHEAKEITSWINPNPAYDAAVQDFVANTLERRKNNRFLERVEEFHQRIIHWGLYNALTQVFLKITSPGIPDIYQGQELWDFSLVDPDNRRPVNYEERSWLLGELEQAAANPPRLAELAHELALCPKDKRLKLLVTWRTLRFRHDYPHLMGEGQYVPVKAAGERAEHVVAFLRQSSHKDGELQRALCVAPRLFARLTPAREDGSTGPPHGADVWLNTILEVPELDGATLQDQFTGQVLRVQQGQLRLAELLGRFPLGLLLEQ